jgi:hypothetical protein
MNIRRPLTIALISSTLLAGLASAQTAAPQPAPAAASTAAPLTLTQLHARLQAAGYRQVLELEQERDRVEAKAQDRDGRWVKLALDAQTGAVLQSKPGSAPREAQATGLDLGQLLSQLEGAGYRAIRKIERERDRVEVRAEDAQGRRVKLALDPQTGAVRSR